MPQRHADFHQVSPRHHAVEPVKGDQHAEVYHEDQNDEAGDIGFKKGLSVRTDDPDSRHQGKKQGKQIQQNKIRMLDPTAYGLLVHDPIPFSVCRAGALMRTAVQKRLGNIWLPSVLLYVLAAVSSMRKSSRPAGARGPETAFASARRTSGQPKRLAACLSERPVLRLSA